MKKLIILFTFLSSFILAKPNFSVVDIQPNVSSSLYLLSDEDVKISHNSLGLDIFKNMYLSNTFKIALGGGIRQDVDLILPNNNEYFGATRGYGIYLMEYQSEQGLVFYGKGKIGLGIVYPFNTKFQKVTVEKDAFGNTTTKTTEVKFFTQDFMTIELGTGYKNFRIGFLMNLFDMLNYSTNFQQGMSFGVNLGYVFSVR